MTPMMNLFLRLLAALALIVLLLVLTPVEAASHVSGTPGDISLSTPARLDPIR